MGKDNSKILSMIERGHSSKDIRKATRAPIMRIAGVRAAYTRAQGKKVEKKSDQIDLKVGTDAHTLVTRLLKQGVAVETLAAATGQSTRVIAAIKAHITMGTY